MASISQDKNILGKNPLFALFFFVDSDNELSNAQVISEATKYISSEH